MNDIQHLPPLARAAVSAELLGQPPPATGDLPASLREPGAAFVTLTRHGNLRGCIGSLEAHQALALDVIDNAKRAAFEDPRFPPVTEEELPGVVFEVSVLTPPEAFPVRNERELLDRLRPGVDGLILRDGPHRSTFLPAVWEDLPDPRDFLAHLKRKAGLPAEHWSDTLRFERYRAVKSDPKV